MRRAGRAIKNSKTSQEEHEHSAGLSTLWYATQRQPPRNFSFTQHNFCCIQLPLLFYSKFLINLPKEKNNWAKSAKYKSNFTVRTNRRTKFCQRIRHTKNWTRRTPLNGTIITNVHMQFLHGGLIFSNFNCLTRWTTHSLQIAFSGSLCSSTINHGLDCSTKSWLVIVASFH